MVDRIAALLYVAPTLFGWLMSCLCISYLSAHVVSWTVGGARVDYRLRPLESAQDAGEFELQFRKEELTSEEEIGEEVFRPGPWQIMKV